MKRILTGIVVLSFVTVLFTYASADLGFRSNPKSMTPEKPLNPVPVVPESSFSEVQATESQPTSQSVINSSSKGIQLRFQDFPLGELLQNIQHETGIQFNLAPQMASVPISVSIEAKNWEGAIRKLVSNYSRVEVWTNKPQTSHVWLMESTPYNQSSSDLHLIASRPRPVQQSTAVVKVEPAPARKSRTKTNPPRIKFKQAKPQARISGSQSKVSLESLPPHILLEPGVLTYLKSKGVNLPNKIKAMYGSNLEGLPRNVPISPHVLSDQNFLSYLESANIQPPQG